jgi:hypothetical protein
MKTPPTPSLPQLAANFNKPIPAGSSTLRELVREYELACGLKPTIKDELRPEIANAMRQRIAEADARAEAARRKTASIAASATVARLLASAASPPSPLADATDADLHVAATHQFSPPKEATAAKAELERRGHVLSASGALLKSEKN